MKYQFLISIAICVFVFSCKKADNGEAKNDIAENSISIKPNREIDLVKLRQKAKEAKVYCKTKGLENSFFILIDLKRHSGLKRFFVWDFAKDTITNSFLVSHGCADNPWGKDYSREKAVVSNLVDSHASSVGKYIVKDRGYSNWGIKVNYSLSGQDETNSNAMARLIVLHSWEEVPDDEIYPLGTPEGWGCPAISNASMRIVDEKLKSTHKKVLLWVIQ